ncbi:MAG: AAA family ATPase, partial [Verrucomicrobiae bacterium]|nr:AAA family ATPase [Verrucomicrobiae bacterium]
EVLHRARAEVAKVIIGQQAVVDQCLIAIFTGHHILIEGVPGIAKTLLVRTLAKVLGTDFSRIQFTPDLMPSDITGTNIFNLQEGAFHLVKGPVFTAFLLADEINRAPAKTQSALLQAMQERQVTIDGVNHALPPSFTVFATQNPIEYEGTYPLPEAQLDRFMFMIGVDYPTREEELAIARTTTGGTPPPLAHVLTGERVMAFQELVRRVPVPDHIYEFAVDLVRRTRPFEADSPEWLKPLVGWGAGPRAVQYLILGAKARAALYGSYMVRLEDVMEVAEPVLRHRVITTFTAESEGITSRTVALRLAEELAKEN